MRSSPYPPPPLIPAEAGTQAERAEMARLSRSQALVRKGCLGPGFRRDERNEKSARITEGAL
jgi:hypothetical protein